MKKINTKHIYIIYILGIIWLIWQTTSFVSAQNYYCGPDGTWWHCDTQIWVTLVNSYSWWINYYNWNNQFYSWWQVFTRNLSNQILVSANDSTIYTISWDIYTSLLWAWSWNYTNIQTIHLSPSDGIKTIHADFLKITEFYKSNNISFVLDQTAPNIANILWPSNWTLISSNNIQFNWSWWNVDTWVWFSWYYIYISLNPNGPFTKIRAWNTNIYNIDSNTLPAWTLYRYIWAIDYLWNESISEIWFFHNKLPTIINQNWWTHNPASMPLSDTYDYPSQKEHFVADLEKVEANCNIHWYDDFADCKATIDDKYKLKNQIYTNYFDNISQLEEQRTLPKALPKSWVDAMTEEEKEEYIQKLKSTNSWYENLIPKKQIHEQTLCNYQNIYINILPRILVIIMAAYIIFDRQKNSNKK